MFQSAGQHSDSGSLQKAKSKTDQFKTQLNQIFMVVAQTRATSKTQSHRDAQGHNIVFQFNQRHQDIVVTSVEDQFDVIGNSSPVLVHDNLTLTVPVYGWENVNTRLCQLVWSRCAFAEVTEFQHCWLFRVNVVKLHHTVTVVQFTFKGNAHDQSYAPTLHAACTVLVFIICKGVTSYTHHTNSKTRTTK